VPVTANGVTDDLDELEILQGLIEEREGLRYRWRSLRAFMKSRISMHVDTFRKDHNSLVDRAARPPWPMDSAEIQSAESRIFATLDDFSEPPFTIQRLAELVRSPSPHYVTLPKYLRALSRCLRVSSPAPSFVDADGLTVVPPPAPLNVVSCAAAARARLISTPLLSPIPFLATLVSGEGQDCDGAPSTPLHLASPLPQQEQTAVLNRSPTGGRVDELDPGTGGGEEPLSKPIALMNAPPIGLILNVPRKPDGSDAYVHCPPVATVGEEDAGTSECMDTTN